MQDISEISTEQFAAEFDAIDMQLLRGPADDQRFHDSFERFALNATPHAERLHRRRLARLAPVALAPVLIGAFPAETSTNRTAA